MLIYSLSFGVWSWSWSPSLGSGSHNHCIGQCQGASTASAAPGILRLRHNNHTCQYSASEPLQC